MGFINALRETAERYINRDDLEYDDDIEIENYDDEEPDSYVSDTLEKIEPRPRSTRRAPLDSAYRTSKTNTEVFSIRANMQMQVVIARPTELNDVADICDYIKEFKTVVINLENVEHETAQRIVDFLSGASHALNGEIQYISKKIFIFAPENVDISGDFKEELRSKGLLFSF